MQHAEIERIASTLMDTHGCHTAILYGSWARGDATPQSDIDLICIREDGPEVRGACIVDGVHIDAFIYPEATLTTLEPSFLRVLGGVVLRERAAEPGASDDAFADLVQAVYGPQEPSRSDENAG